MNNEEVCDKTFSGLMTKLDAVSRKIERVTGRKSELLAQCQLITNAKEMALGNLTLDDIQDYITASISLRRIAVVDIGIMLAHVKHHYFNGDNLTWKKWAMELTEWEERRCYRMVGIGAMFIGLPSDYYHRHKLTDSVKLDIVAQCTEETQREWLSDDRICGMSRERLRVALALLRKNGVKVEHIAKEKTNPELLPGFEQLIDTVGVKGSEGIDKVTRRIDSVTTASKIKETGLNCLMAGVAYLAEDPSARAEVMQTVKELESLCETLRTSMHGTVMSQITA